MTENEMNNQAAQTMPIVDDFNGDNAKLVESARALISLSDSGSLAHHGIGGHARAILSAFIVRTEAAALSQTAGVVEGWKLVPVEPTEAMCEAAMSSLGWTRSEAAAKTAPITPASPMMEGSMKVWSAMLATAPAASGVDTSTNEAWAARAQEKIAAMDASASVSERARAILKSELGGFGTDTQGRIPLEYTLRAIEQALTQQRAEVSAGDAVFAFSAMLTSLPHVVPFGACAWATPGAELATAFNEANGLSVSRDFPQGLKFPEIAGKLLGIVEKAAAQEDTTPQPSADAVREIYDAAAKGFHTSETNGAERKYLHVIRFQSIEDLHGYEDAWTAAMVKARDAK